MIRVTMEQENRILSEYVLRHVLGPPVGWSVEQVRVVRSKREKTVIAFAQTLESALQLIAAKES